MKVIIQRSREASVTVAGEVTGEIDHGYVLLVGLTHGDDEADVRWVADKIANLRLFEDGEGKMNRSILDTGGSILSVSQFTLYADTRKGRRPGFSDAARPEKAELLWNRFNEELRTLGLRVETGVFGAMMDVRLLNDGPVTVIVESKPKE
ncbi:D-aminoacyl-tRNA deacylase [Edaphobacillus lindanitolerans]|uniref:D-aminoacyl-tRNA deacylase n=1 Tax=Edaphobacillus lindanitolerans TaxID=550447 RepID=A0A1U7PQ68_9BACI|nr:D-aminoacyl-tRNA deacylase [Edaphobacillus lindanitolerans]SIT82825.1 D-tyrosyl-tRNA(Tyr) deacylase [Edaphobacillus lindanitolerans]